MSTFSTALEGRVGSTSRVATRLIFNSDEPYLISFTFTQKVTDKTGNAEVVTETWEIGRELLLLGVQAGSAGAHDIVVTHDDDTQTLNLLLRSPEGKVMIVFPCQQVERFLETAEKMCPAKAMYQGFGDSAAKALTVGP